MHISRDLTDRIRKAWQEFIDRTEPVRPELYRYCRGLTGTVWNAEDLVGPGEAVYIMRAFTRENRLP